MTSVELSIPASICLYVIMVLLSTGTMKMASVADVANKKFATRNWLIMTILVISIPSIFRYYVGIDYANYFRVSERLMSFNDFGRAISIGGRLEESYAVLSYLFGRLGMSPAAMIGFYGLLTQIFMVLGIWHLRDRINPTIQFFIYMTYFYFRTYNMARQALSVAIIFFGVHLLLEKKYWRFIWCVVLATVFHRTAIVSLLMIWYFRPAKRIGKISNIVFCYVLPVVFTFGYEYLMTIVSRMPVFSVYVTDTLKYTTFANESFLSLGTALLIIEIVLYMGHRGMYICAENEDLYIGLLDKAMFCQALSFILGMTAGNASRIILYFSFLSMISLSYMFNTKSYRTDGVAFRYRATNVYQIFVILYCIAMFIRIMLNNGFGQLPYRFWI